METRANYIAIGIFTLLVFAMAFGFVYWLIRYNETGEARLVELIIPGSASGLTRGSAVLFNGLRVGSVSKVILNQSDPANVYATIKIDSSTPIREDTAVSIASQPLTGLASVSLVGGSADKDLLLNRDVIPALTAKQSSLNDTIEAVGEAVRVANQVLTKVDGLLDDNLTPINKTIANVEKFSTALSNNADGIDELLLNVGKASTSIASLSETLNGVSSNVEAIINAVDPEKVESTLTNVEKISSDLARSSGEVDVVLDDAKKALNGFSTLATNLNATVNAVDAQQVARIVSNVEGFSDDLRGTLKKVDGLVGALDGERINNTLASLERFAARLDGAGGEIDAIIANAKTATDDVAKFTGTLAENKDNLNEIIQNATTISKRLIATSDAITKLVGRVDGLVEADGRGFIVEATDAARSIRKIAESFEARSEAISAGLARFSTRGLGDIEALIGESRKAVSQIEGVIRGFENNPTQFLLGGKKVPEYRRQRR